MSLDELSTTMQPAENSGQSPPRRVPVLTIISHPDLLRVGECLLLKELIAGRSVKISRSLGVFCRPGKTSGKPLADGFLSRDPFELTPMRSGRIRLAKAACRSEIEVSGRIVDEALTFSREAVEQSIVLVLAKRIVLLLHLTCDGDPPARDHGLVGHSDEINALRQEIDKVSDLSTPILLRGPSGSGKELVARAIHHAGGKNRPFVAVNMGAIAPNLAASELFGAVKGSFTGAERHQTGFFRAAEGGTLFLDEIGEASLEIQVMLLRALESGEVTPVGAQKSFPVKTRLIAATDANLEAKIASESFKAPLFHRLAGFEIGLPPLAKRLQDFGRLFVYFARRELAQMGAQLKPYHRDDPPWLPANMVTQLLAYAWPGNVRQLANIVRQLVIGCRGEASLTMVPKVAELLARPSQNSGVVVEPAPEKRKPSNIPAEDLIAALRKNDYSLTATANHLDISRGALYQLIQKTPGVRKAADLTADQIQTALTSHDGDDGAAAMELQVSARALRRRMTELGMGER